MIVTKTVYLIAIPYEKWNVDSLQYEPCINYQQWCYPSYDGFEAISQKEVSFEILEEPDHRQLKINALEAEKAKLEGEFTARITEIQRQINECLAIEG